MTADPAFARATGVVAASVDGDVILMAPTDGRCYALRGSAGAVWDLLETSRTVPDLVAALTTAFAVDPVRCTQDVSTLLADMRHAGVVDVTA